MPRLLVSSPPRTARRRRGCLAALVAAGLVGSASGSAAGAGEGQLSYDWKVDGAVTVAASAFWGGSQLLESTLAASACRWCNPDSLDVSVRGALRWNDTSAANLASNVGAYAFVPVASLGLLALEAHEEDRFAQMAGNGLVIAESVALAGSVSQIVKLTVGRERPFVHALPPDQKALTANPADNNLSFYSSHTSFAFALAVSSGTVASIRRYRWAAAVWAAGLAGGAVVGYLRIAADQHYFTDVLTGAAAGAAIGFTVPYGFHRRAGGLALVPVAGGGAMLTLTARL